MKAFAYGALWATVPLPAGAFDPAVLAQRYAGAHTMAGILPIGSAPGRTGRHAAFFWSLRRDAVEAWRRRGLAAWQDEVARLWPEAGELVAGISDAAALQPAFYLHFTAHHPVAARLALIGDAAHATSPQLGQGANMGLLDALALSEAMAAKGGLDDRLMLYALRRRRQIRFYQRASRWLTPLFQSDSGAAAALRDLAFPAMRAIPYLRRETVRSLAGLKTGFLTSGPVPEGDAAKKDPD